MSYKLKTLIVFDTNSLRSTEAGEVAYSSFYFGRPFQVIEEFITEKKLTEDVQIAIPTWAIEELKDQKQRQYKADIEAFQKLSIRLSGVPNIPEIKLPEEQFDCAAYVEDKALEYLNGKKVMLLEIKEERANTVLQSMMKRVMKDESKKRPFSHSGKFKDAGFKDNIVWESLMHFEGLADYDKVIFLTKDGDYKNCEIEFKAKWEKHITILQDENNVLVDIQKDYDNYTKERVIHDFAQTEYFKNYLKNDLKEKTAIVVDGEEYKIENFALVDPCKNVDRLPLNEDEIEVENIIINSEIKVHFTINGTKHEQTVEALTTLEDDETKEITSTDYNFELK